ncbi:PLDc N-terminal domain-containing protein [Candidatus Bathyarchaeota archaeon]|nr:PLDc N-terminal domain-containing protein [Candidatus Bathyarchaeota archaeon]
MTGYEWEMTLQPPLWVWIIGIGFFVSICCAGWVNGHAKRYGKESTDRALWTVIAFLFPILGVLLYITIALKQPSQELVQR